MKWAECIFKYPRLYSLKMWLCSHVNALPVIDLQPYIDHLKVLDVGCGPRNLYFHETEPITCVDKSSADIEIRKKLNPLNEYHCCDCRHLPFPDGTFDTVTAFFVIHHMPTPHEEVIRELLRVSRHYLILYDHVLHETLWKRRLQLWYWSLVDGGEKYNSLEEWNTLLAPVHPIVFRRTGNMFQHVIQLIAEKNISR